MFCLAYMARFERADRRHGRLQAGGRLRTIAVGWPSGGSMKGIGRQPKIDPRALRGLPGIALTDPVELRWANRRARARRFP